MRREVEAAPATPPAAPAALAAAAVVPLDEVRCDAFGGHNQTPAKGCVNQMIPLGWHRPVP